MVTQSQPEDNSAAKNYSCNSNKSNYVAANQDNVSFKDNREDLSIVFIHSELDDFGLDPYEMRVYIRIARRAGAGKSSCYESITNIAEGCLMSKTKVKECLVKLTNYGLITKESHPGHPSTYCLTAKHYWKKQLPTQPPPTQPPHDHPGSRHTTTTQPPHDHPGSRHTTTQVAATRPQSIYLEVSTIEVNTISEDARARNTQESPSNFDNDQIPLLVVQDAAVIEAEVIEDSSSSDDHVEIVNAKPIPHEDLSASAKFKKPERLKKFEPSVEAFIDKYEEKNKVPDYGLEFQTWAMDEIGDIVKMYRRSGWVLTRGNDINQEFKKYLATYRKQQNSNFTIGDADAWVVAMEKDPTKWGQLRDRFIEWQGTIQSGNPNFNLAKEMTNHDKINSNRVRQKFNFR